MILNPSNDGSFAAKSVAYTGTAGSTGTWGPGPKCVLVWATTDAYVVVGAGETATTSHTPIPAYTPVVLRVPDENSDNWRVSAIQVSAGGTVYAKPLQG